MPNKILATLGPSSLNEKTVGACTELGVDVFRLNLSHTPLNEIEQSIRLIQSWTDVPICLDSEGAQLRNGSMINERVEFLRGEEIRIEIDPVVGDSTRISFNPTSVCNQFDVGDVIRVDFNHVQLKITEKCTNSYIAVVEESGVIGSNKAADVNRDLIFDPLTEKDRDAIEIGLDNGVRDFAMSFTNGPGDVDLMRKLCGSEAKIICKIESRPGVENLNGILGKADAILIDRGDLSRSVPIELVPFLQRRIISTARYLDTPVFVATNLLETMITTRTPTRAEINDVVSTLEMGATGLVLAAETAIGKYPIEAVQMIRSLIDQSERWTPNTSITDLLGGRE